MRRLALVLAGGALWLILAAVPALADGGPHVLTQNNGSLGINADGCAGCHRAHTAQGPFLLNAADETALCKTCHGAAVTGSNVDVMNGVQYALAGRSGGTLLGALRGGGYDQARLDAGNASRVSYLRSATAVSQRPKVGVGAAEDVTSAHLALAENGLTAQGIAWGNGVVDSGAGPAVELSCASCHNPHGNGQYRILNKIPEPVGAGFDDARLVDIRTSYADAVAAVPPLPAFSADNIYTVTSHGFMPGDQITIAGHTGSTPDLNGTWYVKTVGTGAAGQESSATNNFTISATLGGATVDITVGGTGGTVTRISGVVVTDATLPAPGDTRNYTVMQVKSPTGSSTVNGPESDYLLYASQVAAAAISGTFNGIPGDYTATGGDYFARNVPWNPSINGTCDPTIFPLQAGCATAPSAPNGRPTTFSGQITQWCASCHTRYFANNNPVSDPPTGQTGAAWQYQRPGESLFMYQHRTVSGRDCLTCHVSHGSNAAMTGTFSGSYTYPDGTASTSSRLLKVDNRGTCQACHDPTGTITAGTYIGPVGPTVP